MTPPPAAALRGRVLAEVVTELRTVVPDLPDPLPTSLLLRDELEIDSLDALEFVARVEFRYRLAVSDEDWPKLQTVDAIADYVVARLP